MARKKKQTDIEDAIKEAPRTNSDLTEDERRALHFRHCSEYERALDIKKKADAGLKNCGKRIKAESDSVAKCKQTIQARSPQGEAELRAEIEQTARAAPPHDPGTPAHAKWMEGWHAGQEILMASFQKMPVEDESDAEANGADAIDGGALAQAEKDLSDYKAAH